MVLIIPFLQLHIWRPLAQVSSFLWMYGCLQDTKHYGWTLTWRKHYSNVKDLKEINIFLIVRRQIWVMEWTKNWQNRRLAPQIVEAPSTGNPVIADNWSVLFYQETYHEQPGPCWDRWQLALLVNFGSARSRKDHVKLYRRIERFSVVDPGFPGVGALTHSLANFPRKLHKNEEILGRRGLRDARPLDLSMILMPLLVNWSN